MILKNNLTFCKLIFSLKSRGIFYTFSIGIDIISRNLLSKLLSKEKYMRVKLLLKLGYFPDILKPKTFNEKILNMKLYRNIESLSAYADKLAVRKIIIDEGYSEILNGLYFDFGEFSEINFDRLPERFVMKANHGSGMVQIVLNKNNIDEKELLATIKKWLTNDYNKRVGGTDLHYDNIVPRVIVEKYLVNKDGTPIIDYKFYCMNGKVEFISCVDNSNCIPILHVFSKEWKQLDFGLYNKHLKSDIEKPKMLPRMIGISENLSRNFEFVRIDLYQLDNSKIIFGEYTFFPGGGLVRFVPSKWDLFYGKKLNIN